MKNMINKKNIIFLGLIISLVAGFYVFVIKFNKKNVIKINNNEIKLEIAKNIEQRKRGLGGREELCSNCGMLFEFPEKGRYAFWMKDMKFPLDIVWISDGRIVHLEKNVKSDLKGTLDPEVQADRILEINAGKSDELGLNVGLKILQ